MFLLLRPLLLRVRPTELCDFDTNTILHVLVQLREPSKFEEKLKVYEERSKYDRCKPKQS